MIKPIEIPASDVAELMPALTKEMTVKFLDWLPYFKTTTIIFMEYGTRLTEVMRDGLWRAQFKTVQEFCDAIGLKKRQVYRVVEAVQLTLELEGSVSRHSAQESVNVEVVKRSSAIAISSLKNVSPKTRHAVIAAATTKKGVITEASVAKAKARIEHRPLPPGGLAADAIRARQSAPLPPPVEMPPVKAPEPIPVLGINGDVKAAIVEAIWAAYERDKKKLNTPPPPPPKDMVEWCVRVIQS